MNHAKFERYDAYKDSGVEWLKELPSQWWYFRVKEVCEVKGRIGYRGYNKDDLVNKGEGALLIGASEMHVNGHININNPKFISWFKYYESPEIILCPGDLIIAQRGSTIGKSVLIPDDIGKATINPTLALLKYIKRVNKKYLLYFLMSPSLQNFISSQIASTAIPMISQQQIGNYVIFCPSDPEQTVIIDYLDTKTAQIDRKINLLTQKATQYGKLKQSLINETVTRGLDKTVVMKDSGVEWIGEVPEHWDVRRAKDLFDRKARPCFDGDEIVTAFRDGQVTLRLNRRVAGFTNAIKEHGYQQIQAGDLVIHAMDAFAGAIGVSDSTGKSSPVYSAYTAKDKETVYMPYYGILLRQMALSGFISSLGKGIRERSTEFRHKEFIPLKVVVPALEEQKAIADYLGEKTTHLDCIVETINTQIEKLKELRRTLINDVVIGKIKVA